MNLGRRDGFSLVTILIAVGTVSGIVAATAELLAISKKNFKIAELRASISQDHLDIDTLLISREACTNTFSGLGNIAAATPTAPIIVPIIRDGAGMTLYSAAAMPPQNYYPRFPANDITGMQRAKYTLEQVAIIQGNNTAADMPLDALALESTVVVPARGFAVAFTFRLTDNIGRTIGSPVGDRNFYRFSLFRATFGGGGTVTNCSSRLADEFDVRYVNMKKDDVMTVPLRVNGRMHILPRFADDQFSGYVYAQYYYATSDVRTKENIQSITDPQYIISQIRGVKFDWKNSHHKDSGVIAQELEKIRPDLVSLMPDGYKSVNYPGLIALTTEALRQENEKTQKLKNEVEWYSKRVEKLKEDLCFHNPKNSLCNREPAHE